MSDITKCWRDVGERSAKAGWLLASINPQRSFVF